MCRPNPPQPNPPHPRCKRLGTRVACAASTGRPWPEAARGTQLGLVPQSKHVFASTKTVLNMLTTQCHGNEPRYTHIGCYADTSAYDVVCGGVGIEMGTGICTSGIPSMWFSTLPSREGAAGVNDCAHRCNTEGMNLG